MPIPFLLFIMLLISWIKIARNMPSEKWVTFSMLCNLVHPPASFTPVWSVCNGGWSCHLSWESFKWKHFINWKHKEHQSWKICLSDSSEPQTHTDKLFNPSGLLTLRTVHLYEEALQFWCQQENFSCLWTPELFTKSLCSDSSGNSLPCSSAALYLPFDCCFPSWCWMQHFSEIESLGSTLG